MKGDALLRMADIVARYGVSEKTVRRVLKRRDGSIAAPAFDRPWRWRASDVDAHIAGNEVTDQRKRRRDRLRLAASDQQPTT